MTLPRNIRIDAWAGTAAVGAVPGNAIGWGARRDGMSRSQRVLPFDEPVDETAWNHKDVGYGVLIRDDAQGWTAAKAAGFDDLVPVAVRRLRQARPNTVLLRWAPAMLDSKVMRYFDDKRQPLDIGLTSFGIGKNRLPRFVLIVGGPDQIPWSVQYAFAVRHAVGRLPFDDERLDNYVAAMLEGWAHSTLDRNAPVIWSVDHGAGDITRLMRSVLAGPLATALDGTLPGATHLTGEDASAANLLDRLQPGAGAAPPALIVTSSHGATPTDPAELSATLGLPVDRNHTAVSLDDLDDAMPGGAVWFAQACCSAGGAGKSHYEGLLAPGTVPADITGKVAAIGPVVAPGPLRLLGRPSPVRAVFGHVEPTFDWTLRDPDTGQNFTTDLIRGLSSNLHYGQPLGHIFSEYRSGIGVLNSRWAKARLRYRAGEDPLLEEMVALRLTAIDRQSLVLLGDPTVVLVA